MLKEEGKNESRILLYLPTDLKERLYKFCKKEDIPMQLLIRSLIKNYLDSYENKTGGKE